MEPNFSLILTVSLLSGEMQLPLWSINAAWLSPEQHFKNYVKIKELLCPLLGRVLCLCPISGKSLFPFLSCLFPVWEKEFPLIEKDYVKGVTENKKLIKHSSSSLSCRINRIWSLDQIRIHRLNDCIEESRWLSSFLILGQESEIFYDD